MLPGSGLYPPQRQVIRATASDFAHGGELHQIEGYIPRAGAPSAVGNGKHHNSSIVAITIRMTVLLTDSCNHSSVCRHKANQTPSSQYSRAVARSGGYLLLKLGNLIAGVPTLHTSVIFACAYRRARLAVNEPRGGGSGQGQNSRTTRAPPHSNAGGDKAKLEDRPPHRVRGRGQQPCIIYYRGLDT